MITDNYSDREKTYLCSKKIQTMAGGKKVVHVQLKEPREGQKEHHYFGSLSAIFTELTPEDVGRTYDSVKGMSIEKKLGGSLETKKSIIRIGEIVRKAGNRARKKD